MKKILWLFLMAVLFCFFIGGCSVEEREDPLAGQDNYNFYYLNSSETTLKKQVYVPQEETTDFMLKDLMQRLSSRENPEDGLPLLTETVSINSYDLQETSLVIDFSGGYLEMSRAREVLTRAGIAEMFLQIPDIETVRFTVEGENLTDSRNQVVGAMTEETFLELSGRDTDAYRCDTFTLYFTDKSGEKLMQEERNVYYPQTMPKEMVVLAQLAKGPAVDGHYRTISEDTLPISAITADRICYINMNRSFRDDILAVAENIQIYSIVNSILDSCEADRVQISIEGSLEGDLKSSMPLYSFYEKNEDLISSEETAEDIMQQSELQ